MNPNILEELVVSRLLRAAAAACGSGLRALLKGNARCGERERRPVRCHGHWCGIKSLCMFIAFARAGGGALECD